MSEFSAGRRTLLKLSGAGVASLAGVGRIGAQQTTNGGDLLWTFSTEDSVFRYSSPSVVDGTVFVGSGVGNEYGTLYAVDAETGKQEWMFAEPSDIVGSSPAVMNGTVFVTSAGSVFGEIDGALYAVDAKTGTKAWERDLPGFALYSPTAVGGTVYVGSTPERGRGRLYAIDASTGNREWVRIVGDVQSPPTVVDGIVYLGADTGEVAKLHAIYAKTGQQRWTFTAPTAAMASSPTVADGTVFFGCSDETLYAVDVKTGQLEWTFESDMPFESSPTVADGTVYIGSGTFTQWGTLYAVNAETGEEEWAFTDPVLPVTSSPTVADGTVFVGEIKEKLYAVNAETGEQEWAFGGTSGLAASPTVVDGTVYIGSYDGNLYAIDAGVEGSSEGSRVNLGTLGHHDAWPNSTGTYSGPPPLPGNRNRPQDLDGDGRYEDITGTAETPDEAPSLADVVALFRNQDSPEVQDYAQYYQFNDADGDTPERVSVGDVAALFRRV